MYNSAIVVDICEDFVILLQSLHTRTLQLYKMSLCLHQIGIILMHDVVVHY